jgi:hypothetical protein
VIISPNTVSRDILGRDTYPQLSLLNPNATLKPEPSKKDLNPQPFTLNTLQNRLE